MKKILCFALSFLFVLCLCLTGCGTQKEIVVIYTSSEDYNIELLQERLDAQFPNYEIAIEYMSTSNIAAKAITEGRNSEIDIVAFEEYGYMEKMVQNNVLANISTMYDFSVYEDDTLIDSIKDYVLPAIRTGGAVIINTGVLAENDIEIPTSYADLLDSNYEGLISMPSPKSSGTGYMFLLALVNEMGETAAFEYFDELAGDGTSGNILAFTTSGSGPVNALISGEVAVGFGMISQAAQKITEQIESNGSSNLEIVFLGKDAPYNLYGHGIIKGKETRKAVRDVMNYLYSNYTEESCSKFYPEKILKDSNYSVDNFPISISYADMSGNTLARKEELLELWIH